MTGGYALVFDCHGYRAPCEEASTEFRHTRVVCVGDALVNTQVCVGGVYDVLCFYCCCCCVFVCACPRICVCVCVCV